MFKCRWRGFATRVQYIVQLSSIVTIQSVARRRFAKSLFMLSRVAAVMLQKFARRFIATRRVTCRRAHVKVHQRTNSAALKIQVSYLLAGGHRFSL